jgi:hypothetical protein
LYIIKVMIVNLSLKSQLGSYFTVTDFSNLFTIGLIGFNIFIF